MGPVTTEVALRSDSTELIDAVRTVLAVAGLPLAIYPQQAPPPSQAGLVLDGGEEADPSWRHAGMKYARVTTRTRGNSALTLPEDAEDLLLLARAANQDRRARVIGVIGARGGVGASALAAVLARVSVRATLATALVDGGDGAPVDVLLNLEHEPGLRWADVGGAGGIDPAELASALPVWSGVRVLCADHRPAPLSGHADDAVLALAHAHDVVVMDLPRHALRAGLAARWCDVLLLVTTSDVASVSAARSLTSTSTGEDIRLVVRGPVRDGLTPAEIADACEVPIAVTMRPERSLTASLARGLAPGDSSRGPLRRHARALVTELRLDE